MEESCEMIDVKCRRNEGLSLASNLHLIVSLTQLFVSLDLPHLSPAGYAETFLCEFVNDSSMFGHTNKHRVTTSETGSCQRLSIGSNGVSWISQRAPTPDGGVPTYYFAKFVQKTA